MCYIIVKPSSATMSADYVVGARNLGNKDGIGIMYAENGRVVVKKSLSCDEDLVRDFYNEHSHLDLAIHLRHQTLGSVSFDNVHPFNVLSIDDGDPFDLELMHNGTIQGIQVEPDRADSYNLAVYTLRPYLKVNPDAVKSPEFWNIFSMLLGKSKLVLLTSLGEFIVVNSDEGKLQDFGVWTSKPDKVTPVAPKVYTSTSAIVPVPTNNSDKENLPPFDSQSPVSNLAWKRGHDNKYHLTILGEVIDMPKKSDAFKPEDLEELAWADLLEIVQECPREITDFLFEYLPILSGKKQETANA